MSTDLDRLLVFRDVVECGGFAQAAQRRGTGHSTISRQVKELESSLGVPLMTRTTRSKQLTAAGEVVLAYGRRIGEQFDQMRHELERLEQVVGGELRVHALTHVGDAIVMPAVAAFAEQHPDVELKLQFDDAPLEFHRHGLDLAVTVGLPAAERLVVRKLCDNDVCLVASAALVGERGLPESPSELLEWPTVAYASGDISVTSWNYELDGVTRALVVQPDLTVNGGVALLDAVRRGLGVGYLSWFSVADDLRSGALVRLLPDVRLPAYAPVYTAKADLDLVSARVEAFERCLHAAVGNLSTGA